MESTGPNTSSLAIRMFLVTPAKAVGLNEEAFI